MEQFQPNANNILDVLYNKKPKYLPLYEQHIDIEFIAVSYTHLTLPTISSV